MQEDQILQINTRLALVDVHMVIILIITFKTVRKFANCSNLVLALSYTKEYKLVVCSQTQIKNINTNRICWNTGVCLRNFNVN